jgi:hypothetical protein
MKTTPFYLLIVLIIGILVSCNQKQDNFGLEEIDEQLDFAIQQYKSLDSDLSKDLLPRSIDENGKLVTSGSDWWCSGFFPGTLWYLYEYSGNEELKQIAHQRTMLIEKEQYNTGTHDLGFMLYCSFGNGLRLTGNEEYTDVLVQGAQSLISRFNETTGCIQSWDHGKWQFPVIIDNMMNLDLLFWAAYETADTSLVRKSISHSDQTIKHHYREDYSAYHLVDYDTITGEPAGKQTVQGYADESAWARGQAWGLYGYVSLYRNTRDQVYLNHAEKIADFILNHPNLPEDLIPCWDFDAPDIPDAKRDASAGSIIASALIDLSDLSKGEASKKYLDSAVKILKSLSSDKYRANYRENGNFILMHSVGHLTANSEVDVPLTYADYYFVEALMRLRAKLVK